MIKLHILNSGHYITRTVLFLGLEMLPLAVFPKKLFSLTQKKKEKEIKGGLII